MAELNCHVLRSAFPRTAAEFSNQLRQNAIPAILLDLDGTRIDPKEGITPSNRHALRELRADVAEHDGLAPSRRAGAGGQG